MKWTLVTGGAKRLGAEICRGLAAQGKNVVVHYYSSEREAYMLAEELRAIGVRAELLYGDFSSLASTRAFMENYLDRFSKTEGLVNNLGPYRTGSSLQDSVEEAQNLLHLNVLVPLVLVQALTETLKKEKGFIINIGMVGCGTLSANTHAAVYNVTKSALYQFTKSWAKELADSHVKVNMVSPGYLEESIDLPVSVDLLPMRRVGSWKEIARAVCFLTLPGSEYITGQNIEVAGGVKL
jgi:NAD(P)-dependent dehydrogenase (short-subunit alcohol dehydrogenase family)